MATIKFGTDGWRAVIAEDFTFANLERVAQAAADAWSAKPVPKTRRQIVVGYDRRFLSDQFGRRVAEVFAGNDFEVLLTSEPTPTPAVSLAVKEQGCVGGVMITASHNPPSFNGFKLKSWFGGSAEPSETKEVEGMLDRHPVRAGDLSAAVKSGTVVVEDIRPAHYRAIKKLVDFKLISKSHVRFAHDALYGVGAGCFDTLLAKTRCQVTTLNGEHDPNFGGINPEPIPKNYARSSAWLRRHPQDFCVVTDGDADRVGGMDGHGRPLTTHQVICLILYHLVINRQGRGRVVKALTATSMIDKMCAAWGLELVETGVGFKYVAAEMMKGGVLLGAEESGGIGFQGHIPERDGILAGLMILELLATEKVSANRLLANFTKQFGPHYYDRLDTHYPLEQRAALIENCVNNPPLKLLRSPVTSVKSFDGVKYVAQDGTWLMLRGSGTEPILRIYAEAKSPADVQKLLHLGLQQTTRPS